MSMSKATSPKCILLIVAVLVARASTTEARLCSPIPADRALAEATLVVKATLVSTTPPRIREGDSTSIIRIIRVLKGRVASSEIPVTHFLCGIEDRYTFHRGGPFIAFIDTAHGRLVRGTAVLPAATHASPVISEPRRAVREELLLAMAEPDTKTARAALGALAELDGRASVPILRQYSRQGSFGVRFRALAWLTRFGDPDAVSELARVVSAPPFDRELGQLRLTNEEDEPVVIAQMDLHEALTRCCDSSPSGSATPGDDAARFVATMGQLAQMKDIRVRRGAVRALRRLNQRASFPILAAALDDPDEWVRYHAMFTLCMAMNADDLRCPAASLFRQDEQKYISRVRAWANAQHFEVPPD